MVSKKVKKEKEDEAFQIHYNAYPALRLWDLGSFEQPCLKIAVFC